MAAIISTILLGTGLAALFGLRRRFEALTGGAVAICGASAAMAISSILPNDESRERDTLLTIVGVTSLSTMAMVLYPIIAGQLALNDHDTAIFLGGTIHDVAQVVGAGYSMSEQTGDLSTLIKLVRVSLLFPVVACMLIAMKQIGHQQHGGKARVPGIPWFLTAFVILMMLNSMDILPAWLNELSSHVWRFALIIAIAAIGMKSNLASLLEVGVRPIALMVIETAWIAGFIIVAIHWL